MPTGRELVLQEELDQFVRPFRLIQQDEGSDQAVFVRGVVDPVNFAVPPAFEELIVSVKGVIDLGLWQIVQLIAGA